MAAFLLRLDLAIKVNHHFLENDYGDLSFFCCFQLSNKFLYVKLKYVPILSVEQETIAHFRVYLSLSINARPSAQPFI